MTSPPEDPLVRILAMPRVVYRADVMLETIRHAISAPAPILRQAQSDLLRAMRDAAQEGSGPLGPRGVVGMLGCGHGKWLCAQLAPSVFGSRRPAIFMPASLIPQATRELAKWSKWYRTHPGISLYSYELLSTPKSSALLFDTQPDLLIFDEAHCLANEQSARWKRVRKYLIANQQCRVVCLSGTLTDRSLGQMRHLLYVALRDWSPLPDDGSLRWWLPCIDIGGEASSDDIGYLSRLATWAGQDTTKEGFRKAFRERLTTARGVVVTAGAAVTGVSLRLSFLTGPPQPKAVIDAQVRLDAAWELPDGTELVDVLEHSRAARQLSLGFFTRYVPSTVRDEWKYARKAWSRVLRDHCTYGSFESPAGVEERAREGRLSASAQRAWTDWELARDPAPESEVIWMDEGREWLRATVQDWLGTEPGLVWFSSRAVGDALRGTMPTHGAGSDAPTARVCAASIRVHGTGWNGQAYHRQLVLEPPSNGGRWEQLLNRTHRPGQTEDVTCAILQATETQRSAFHTALAGARYIEQTTGEPQRLLFADRE